MRIDRHVYGSVTGYQTLARSDGIAPADLTILENLTVGQSSDASFLRSLASRPAYIVRTIGHRRSITQIVPGAPDDANRPTTRKVSLLFSVADWDVGLRGDIGSLVDKRELWQWSGEAKLTALNASLTGQGQPVMTTESAQKLLSILSLLERAWSSRRSVVLREKNLTLDEFRLLGMLIPPAARSAYCGVYRSLTADMLASLICLAEQSPLPASAETYRAGNSVEFSTYARMLTEAGFGNGIFPLEFIQSYRSFGMPPKQVARDVPQRASPSVTMPTQVIVERTPRGLLTVFLLACILLPIASGACMYLVMRSRYYNQTAADLGKLMRIPIATLASQGQASLKELRSDLAARLPDEYDEVKKRAQRIEPTTQKAPETPSKAQTVTLPAEESKLNDWLRNGMPVFGQTTHNATTTSEDRLFASVGRLVNEEAEKSTQAAKRETLSELVESVWAVLGSPQAANPHDTSQSTALVLLRAVLEAINKNTKELSLRVEIPKATNERLQADESSSLPHPAENKPAKAKLSVKPNAGQGSNEPSASPAGPEAELANLLKQYQKDLLRVKTRTDDDKNLLQVTESAIRDLAAKDPNEKKAHNNFKKLKEMLQRWPNPQLKWTLTPPPDIARVIELIEQIMQPSKPQFTE